MEIWPTSFLVQTWSSLSRRMNLTIPPWSTLQSGRKIFYFDDHLSDGYFSICFLLWCVVFHRNSNREASDEKQLKGGIVSKMVITIDYLVARSKHVALWDPFCDQTVKMKGGRGGSPLPTCWSSEKKSEQCHLQCNIVTILTGLKLQKQGHVECIFHKISGQQ